MQMLAQACRNLPEASTAAASAAPISEYSTTCSLPPRLQQRVAAHNNDLGLLLSTVAAVELGKRSRVAKHPVNPAI